MIPKKEDKNINLFPIKSDPWKDWVQGSIICDGSPRNNTYVSMTIHLKELRNDEMGE